LTYTELDAKLQGRCKHHRKLSHNTTAHRDYSGLTKAIFILYHNTDIMSFYPNGDIKLHIGNWFTVTTKQRLNQYLPSGIGVYSHRGEWFLYRGQPMAVFTNGMTIHPDGRITGTQSFDDWEAERIEGVHKARSNGAKQAAITRKLARKNAVLFGDEYYA
jgi:hypothetical protein